MSASRTKLKGRSNGTFFAIPHAVMRSENWKRMPARAVKLICALGVQYNGKNNGDLSAEWPKMRALGWRSPNTVDRAEIDAMRFGMIERTHRGGRHSCHLYALTWLPIHECGGKLEVPATNVASGLWKEAPQFDPSFVNKKLDAPKLSTRHHDRLKNCVSKRKTV